MFVITQGFGGSQLVAQGYGAEAGGDGSDTRGKALWRRRWTVRDRSYLTIGRSIGMKRFELSTEDTSRDECGFIKV